MLLCNYSYVSATCGHNHSGVTSPRNFLQPHTMRGWYGQQQNDNIDTIKLDSINSGTEAPYALVMSPSRGLISATTTISGSGVTNNLNLAGGLNAESDLTGAGSISSANLTAIAAVVSALSGLGTLNADIIGKLEAVSNLVGQGNVTAALGALSGAVAAITGQGTINANLASGIAASANLSGTGTLNGDIFTIVNIVATFLGASSINADITGNWPMSSSLSGSATLAADITAVANLVKALSGSSLLTASSGATAEISADIAVSVPDPLSPESLAAALWNSLATLYNNPGTMGQLINSAGGAADPWLTVLPGSYTAGTAGDIIGNLQTNLQVGLPPNVAIAVWDESKLSHVTADTMGKVVQDLETLIRQVKALTAAQL